MSNGFERSYAKNVEEKYEMLLSELKTMKNGTQEERELRYKWIRKHKEYDQFVVDVMNECKPKAYEKLRHRLENNPSTTLKPNSGIASIKKEREIDTIAFMEAIKTTIEGYTGENQKGESYTFIQGVGKNYNQESQRLSAYNDISDGGIVVDVTDKKKYLVIKYANTVKKLQAASNNSKSFEDFIEEAMEIIGGNGLSAKEKEEVKRRVIGLDIIASLDYALTDDNQQTTTLGDILPDENNSIEGYERNLFWKSFFEKMACNFEEKWAEVVAATNKANRELLKVFLSRNILIALKLEYLEEKERKTYKRHLEPTCGQWCPKEKCEYDVKHMDRGDDLDKTYIRKEGCYMRYGFRPEEEENGDRDIYNLLKMMDEQFYELVLNNDYVKFAFMENVDNLYDIYSKKLKSFEKKGDNETFRFTDIVLATALGEDKAKISRFAKWYRFRTQKELFKIFCVNM